MDNLFKNGRSFSSPSLSLRFINDPSEKLARISVSVPKSVTKKAVARNSLRRKGYRAIQKIKHPLPQGFVGMLLFKKNIASFEEIEKDVAGILNKIN